MTDQFFTEKQGAAAMKHAILKRYLPGFVGATGSTSTDHVVYYIDGYSGPGQYDDGEAGSPMIALALAEAMSEQRSLRGVCIESDPMHYQKLADLLDGVDGWEAMLGTAEVCLPVALKRTAGRPVFVFLDPFGVKQMPFETVRNVLLRGSTKTEVLVRIDTTGLKRIAGHLTSPHRNEATLANNDRFLGGPWWRSLESVGTDGFIHDIVDEYVRRLRDKSGGFGYFRFPISEKPGGVPKYSLVHFTQWNGATWKMNEAISMSRQDARDAVIEPTLFDIDDDNWIGEIADNVMKILTDTDSFIPQDSINALFGNVLGHARETHVRQAFNRLYADEQISTDPKGKKLPRLRVYR
ncbi:MAG: three-Cys-motif partner protein TcmP [Acidimicrobiia bacterium]|nr:three-Cys-motif partner protein TcmP [Acidimicrobiia bacterium]